MVHDDIYGEHQTKQLLAENQLLTEALQHRVDQLAAINSVAASAGRSLNLEATLETALDAVLAVIPVQAAGISMVSEEAGELVLLAQRGWKQDFITSPMRIPLGEGISGEVVRKDKVLVMGDVSDDPRLAIKRFANEGVQAMVLAPMHAQGQVIGVLSVMHYEPYVFSDEQITLLQVIADEAGIALANARLYELAKQQSSRLGAVLDSSGDGIIATDHQGRINLVNATAQKIFNLKANYLLGVPLIHAPFPGEIQDELQRILAPGTPTAANTVFDVTVHDRVLSIVVSPVYSASSASEPPGSNGWVMVMREVTHLRQAEQTRLNFIHAAAHDLRNPLSATFSALKMLEEDFKEEQDAQEIIGIALMSVNRMHGLIDDLLNLEHIESGIGLEFAAIDIPELVERTRLEILPGAKRKSQAVNVAVVRGLPPLIGDIHWLQRALTNLVSNAHKYTQEGGAITLRAFAQDSNIYLEVEDNGPGIPIELQARIFERFYRAPNSDDSAKGSGLGLAIVKSIAEKHGGRVYVQSQEGEGCIFGLALPINARY